MFDRVDGYFVITTNNLRALEAISETIFVRLRRSYCIQIETFSSMTLYRFYMYLPNAMDERVRQMVEEDLKARHIKLMEES